MTSPSLRLDQSGTYRVVMNDASGTATNSNSVALTVNAPPVIVPSTTFQHKAVAFGASTSFTVSVTSSGTTTYQWLKNGVESLHFPYRMTEAVLEIELNACPVLQESAPNMP